MSDKYKKALDVAIGELSKKARHAYCDVTTCEEASSKALTAIKFILHPLPEMEAVEVERFIVFYPDGSTSHVLTREGLQHFDCKGGMVERVAKTITRPKKQPIEKSARVMLVEHDGVLAVQIIASAGVTCNDLIGKEGHFVWAE